MSHEHDDDLAAEVHEITGGEADQYADVDDDFEQRTDDAERERLLEMQHNLEQAEGDEPEKG
jgi:hypothetical protein